MRFAFIGAVEGSKHALGALIAAGLVPDLVVTLPPEAASRHSDFADITTPAVAAGAHVFHATNINAAATLAAISAAEPDLCLVIGWSQICREPFRSIARIGNIGFHPAALPSLRGRAVIPWTILLGEVTTGSTLFWLDEGTDSGAILMQRIFPLATDETARTLYAKHTTNLEEMLPQAVELAGTGSPPRREQDHALATYCAKRTPEDGLIDWRQPAATVLRLIRAVGDPYPGAFTYSAGTRLTVDEAAPFPDSHRYIGLVGQVQTYTDAGFVVRCGDGECIEVRRWRCLPAGRPKIHSKLSGEH
jgi:methionyl-tRNA formyltransferase